MPATSTRSGAKRAAADPETDETGSSSDSGPKRQKTDKDPEPDESKEAKSDEAEQSTSRTTLQITEEAGDIFDAPTNTLIIHACNCEGSWGGGIAKAFKGYYPEAYSRYADYCEEHGHSLMDTAQLIPPVDAGVQEPSSLESPKCESTDNDKAEEKEPTSDDQAKQGQSKLRKHFVGCLYTSRQFGRNKDTPKRILAATKPAMEDLLKQIAKWNSKASNENKIGQVRMCKINSGLFAVPWEKSKALLETIDVEKNEVKTIKVVSPE